WVFLRSRRGHRKFSREWSSDVCSSELIDAKSGVRFDTTQGLVSKAERLDGLAMAGVYLVRTVKAQRRGHCRNALLADVNSGLHIDRKSVGEGQRAQTADGGVVMG